MVQAWGRPGLGAEGDREPSAYLVGLTVWREMQTGKQAITNPLDEGDWLGDASEGKGVVLKNVGTLCNSFNID